MCKTRVLSTRGNTVLSSCTGCGVYYLWHNNLLLNFTEEAFLLFREVVNSLPFEDNSLPFPNGEERIVLNTPNHDICFAFAEDEFEEFKIAIDEAIYMNEVYQLMRK
ncbi:DUF6686 family protein [Pedobacter sp.]|jgi:hypothetical protein|uniref:DUF6686 family protein n=1 Tax=Pedobacter sp. TaxID=1411316 RepID=UPI002C39A418|nr:DUF6686 family protein [Pedobacter sp.]HWW41702.1 DUF6686 family protein [Pedobacter sp.]